MTDDHTVERVDVSDGKYTVILNGKNFRALRYGEEWQDLTGNNLVWHLSHELSEARAAIQPALAEAEARGRNMGLREALDAVDEADSLELAQYGTGPIAYRILALIDTTTEEPK